MNFVISIRRKYEKNFINSNWFPHPPPPPVTMSSVSDTEASHVDNTSSLERETWNDVKACQLTKTSVFQKVRFFHSLLNQSEFSAFCATRFFVLKLLIIAHPGKNFLSKELIAIKMRAICFGPVKYDWYCTALKMLLLLTKICAFTKPVWPKARPFLPL